MGPPEQVDQTTREDEVVLTGKRRIVEEVVVGLSALEGEHDMVVDQQADPETKYRGYQALVNRAVDVFGDELTASRWLSMPSVDLDGDIPLHVAQKLDYEPARLEKVFERIFVRIEHGVYF